MPKLPRVLGIQYGSHDTAAALLVDGEVAAACEQERYTLEKHTFRFPHDAVADCLHIAGLGIADVDALAVAIEPMRLVRETFLRSALDDDARIGFLLRDIEVIRKHYEMETRIRQELDYRGPLSFHRHHLCHLASAYYPSGFDEALLVSYDGMGEIETSALGIGRGSAIDVVSSDNLYPDSVGLLYAAVTCYLGWKHSCDEGIVMGLAPYGNAMATIPGDGRTYSSVFADILQETGDYTFRINRDWIAYHQVWDKWVSDRFTALFGPKREPGSELTEQHMNIAAALQQRLEDVVLAQLQRARRQFGLARACFAGGVALNCSMNGRIAASGIFDEIFVQPGSGDNGTALGAAYLALAERAPLAPAKRHDFLKGSRFGEAEIAAALDRSGLAYTRSANIYQDTAARLKDGKIVAWFQGAAEFGPRALGNRSILTRPYPAGMKDYLNARVKFREYFRPFAPSVLAEHAGDYFQMGQESPHMLIAVQAVPERRDEIPAVVHVDGTCRVQTVTPENNPRLRLLLEEFHRQTGCPVLLNTSFNVKGQPIINTPEQAITCFQSTNIDFLVLGDYYTEKVSAANERRKRTGNREQRLVNAMYYAT